MTTSLDYDFDPCESIEDYCFYDDELSMRRNSWKTLQSEKLNPSFIKFLYTLVTDTTQEASLVAEKLKYQYCCENKRNLQEIKNIKRKLSVTDEVSEMNIQKFKSDDCKLSLKSEKNNWIWKGNPFEDKLHTTSYRRKLLRICYPCAQHKTTETLLEIGDAVMVRVKGEKQNQASIGQITALWEQPKTNKMMASLKWFYRSQSVNLPIACPYYEIFSSDHLDIVELDCIENKCYVLTYDEYCRYRKVHQALLEEQKHGHSGSDFETELWRNIPEYVCDLEQYSLRDSGIFRDLDPQLLRYPTLFGLPSVVELDQVFFSERKYSIYSQKVLPARKKHRIYFNINH